MKTPLFHFMHCQKLIYPCFCHWTSVSFIPHCPQPTVAAIEAGKDIALANKETLIAGGPFVLPLAHKHNVKILPADSEHSAIFQVQIGLYLRNGCPVVVILIRGLLLWLQCIQGLPEGALRRIILTASGGAFRFVTTKLFVKINAWRRRKLKIDLLDSILGLWGSMTWRLHHV